MYINCTFGVRMLNCQVTMLCLLIHVYTCIADPSSDPNVMYIKKKDGKWIAVRGSSKLEGMHKFLAELPTASHMSVATAQGLMELFIGCWNMDRAWSNAGQENYHIYDIRCVNV
jgi:hypothetical protein